VVFDGGTGDAGLTWILVQPDVATFTRACAYDRAGLGWSDPSPKPRTAEVMVEEIRSLLEASESEPPYLMVAQSFGGIVARLFAHRFPRDVSGMVLVDSAHEEQFLRFPEAVRTSQQSMLEAQVQQFAGLRSMIEAGSFDSSILPVPPAFPPEAAEAYRTLVASGTTWLDTMVAELQAVEEAHAQVRGAQIRSLGDIPLVVLRHGKPIPSMPEMGIGSEDMDRYERTWQELQEELVGLSPRGKLVVAEESGHMIHQEQPELVVDAIREVVEEVRR
jgi:pimeloyl-ACP methyl ester carboxylesterase